MLNCESSTFPRGAGRTCDALGFDAVTLTAIFGQAAGKAGRPKAEACAVREREPWPRGWTRGGPEHRVDLRPLLEGGRLSTSTHRSDAGADLLNRTPRNARVELVNNLWRDEGLAVGPQVPASILRSGRPSRELLVA